MLGSQIMCVECIPFVYIGATAGTLQEGAHGKVSHLLSIKFVIGLLVLVSVTVILVRIIRKEIQNLDIEIENEDRMSELAKQNCTFNSNEAQDVKLRDFS